MAVIQNLVAPLTPFCGTPVGNHWFNDSKNGTELLKKWADFYNNLNQKRAILLRLHWYFTLAELKISRSFIWDMIHNKVFSSPKSIGPDAKELDSEIILNCSDTFFYWKHRSFEQLQMPITQAEVTMSCEEIDFANHFWSFSKKR